VGLIRVETGPTPLGKPAPLYYGSEMQAPTVLRTAQLPGTAASLWQHHVVSRAATLQDAGDLVTRW
jgi:hypothetical protein